VSSSETFGYTLAHTHIRGCIQKFPDLVDNEKKKKKKNNNNKHSLRSKTKAYGGKIHKMAIQLHLMAASCVPFAVLAPGGQSGNFWIDPHILRLQLSGERNSGTFDRFSCKGCHSFQRYLDVKVVKCSVDDLR
jgi:hypothetical protein